MNIKQLIAVALFSTLMVGCGGGDDDGDSKGGGISLGGSNGGGNDNGGNPHQKLLGDWMSSCIPLSDNGNGVRGFTLTVGYFIDDDDGEEDYGEAYRYYDTSTCNSNLLLRVAFAGPITYQGQFTSSVCVAEQYQATFLGAFVENSNGKESMVGAELDAFLNEAGMSKTRQDRACIYNNQLLLGDDNNGMALGSPFSRKNQKVISLDADISNSIQQVDSNMIDLLERSQNALRTH